MNISRAIRRQMDGAARRLVRMPQWQRMFCLSTVLVLLLLMSVYWQTGDIQAANATKDDSKPVTKKAAEGKSNTNAKNSSSTKANSKKVATDKSNSESKDESSLSADQKKIFELMEQYSKAIETKGENDPETKKISKKLDDAITALQKKMESEMNIQMDTLPSAPKEGPGAQGTPKITKPEKPPTPPKTTKPPVTPGVKPAVPPKTTKPPDTSDVKPIVPPKTTTPTVVSPQTTKPPKTVTVVRPAPVETTTKPATAKPVTTKPPTAKSPTETTPSKVPGKTAPAKSTAPTPPKPTAPTPAPTKPKVTTTIIKADPNSPEPSPDDIVILKIEENMLEVQFLVDLVGKELKLNIIYDSGQPIVGKVYMQQFGIIRRKDLTPLMETILGLQGYSMIREGSIIRIFKRDPNILKKSKPRIIFGEEMVEVLPGETLLTQIIEVQHVKVAEVQKFLANFISDTTAIKTIAGTNYLIITEYVNRLPRILEMVSLIDRAGVPRKLKAIIIKHIPVRDARTHVEALLKALVAQGATTFATTTSTPAPKAPTKAKTAAELRAERIRQLADQRRAAAGGTAATAIPQGPTLYTYDLTSQLLVIGTDDQIKQVEELLEMLDVEPPGPEIQLEIIQVEYVTASGASSKVKGILDSLQKQVTSGMIPTTPIKLPTSSRTPRPPTSRTPTPQTITAGSKGPVFHLDERTNRIFLVGYAEQILQAKELLDLIDIPAGPEIKLEVITVEYVEPDAVATQIQSLIQALNENTAAPERSGTPISSKVRTTPPTSSRPRTTPGSSQTMLYDQTKKGPAIFVDKRTTRLFAVGSDDQIKQVKEMLALLDVEAGKPIRLEILRVQNVEASEIADEVESIIKALNESSAPGVDSFQQTVPIPSPTGSRTSLTSTRTTPRLSTTIPRGRSTPALATEQGPALFVDGRNNRLLVVGNDEQIEQVKEILALLDVVEGPEIKIAVLRVQYVEAADVGPEVEDLLEALYEKGAGTITPTGSSRITPAVSSPRPGSPPSKPTTAGQPTSRTRTGETEKKRGPAIFIDERTNRLLVVGSEEQITQVKELLALLDVLEGPEIKLVAVRVEHVMAIDVADQVRELLDALYESGAYMPGVHRPGSALTPTSTKPAPRTTPTTPGARTTPPTQPKTTTSNQNKESGAAGPVIVVDERTNRLLVVGSEDQIEQFKSILAMLDVKEGPEIRLVTIEIKHVIADDISGQLEELINAFNEQGGKATRATTSTMSTSTSGTSATPTSAAPRDSRRTSPTTAQRKGGSARSPEELGPFILVDSRTNRLLIVGSDEQIDQLKELLKVLDVPPSEYYRLLLQVYQPQYVEVTEVQRIMDDLGITQSGEQSPRDQARSGADDTTGARGAPAPSGPGSTTSSSTTTVGGLFSRGPGEGMLLPGQEEPEVRMAIQESTNKIYILATEYQHRDIEEIMKHVDVEPEDDIGDIEIFALENREPGVVAEMLQSLLESEKEAREAAGGGVEKIVTIPGKEGAPIIVALEDIYAVAVRGSKKQREEIGKIIKILDKRLPSVLVEAILVQVSTDDILNVGVSLKQGWDVGGARNTTRNVTGASPFGLNPTLVGDIVFGEGGTLAYFDDELIFATLEALQTQGDSKIASMPRVLVNDNEEGSITNQRQEPTTRTTIPAGSDTPIIEFAGYEEAGTILTITPHISEGDFLKLTISLDVNSFQGKGSANVPPPKSVNNISTTVNVPNGKYIVLGGLTSTTESTTVNKIPIIGDIPLLGFLFRNTAITESEAVLYVFVKANIVGKDEFFVDLDNLSNEYRQKLRDSEVNYQGQSVIPGIPEQKERTSVLDN